MAEAEVFQAITGFVTYETGTAVVVRTGDLVVKGHWLIKGREDSFKPVTELVRHGPETATKGPRKVSVRRKRAAREPKAEVETATKAPGETKTGGITAQDVPGATA